MKVFITKYALTRGIFETDAEIFENSPTNRIISVCSYSTKFYSHNEWHTSKEEAILEAEKMRNREIDSLKNDITKLEQLEF